MLKCVLVASSRPARSLHNFLNTHFSRAVVACLSAASSAAPFQRVTLLLPCLQPTDDIVLMAQALEKIFLQKVAQMPQEEVELLPPAPKGKGRKPASGTQSAGEGGGMPSSQSRRERPLPAWSTAVRARELCRVVCRLPALAPALPGPQAPPRWPWLGGCPFWRPLRFCVPAKDLASPARSVFSVNGPGVAGFRVGTGNLGGSLPCPGNPEPRCVP